PFVLHPIGVARVLADMRMDVSTICAALLHDVLEDTATTKSELQAEFGPVVADLVDGVSKLTHMPIHSQEELQAENLRKMILAMAKDIRVIVIKLADRLHNLQTIHALPTEKRRRKALETLEIYAPLAARLGMHQLKLQLEDLGFAALYPMRYRTLKKAQESGFRKEMVQGIETQFN
ncbi:MAG: HD domain-containing protein, partial [Pseudomonadota bacterium]